MSGSKKRPCRKCGGMLRDSTGHCVPCSREYGRNWRINNPEKEKASKAKYWPKFYASNAQKLRDRTAKHAKDNPAYYAAHASKRRAKIKNAVPSWFDELDEFVIHEAAALCRLRKKTTGIKWHIDHIVPLQSKIVCGLHIGCNIQVIPAIQNHKKSNLIWPDMP
jgi:hypothetical protein